MSYMWTKKTDMPTRFLYSTKLWTNIFHSIAIFIKITSPTLIVRSLFHTI